MTYIDDEAPRLLRLREEPDDLETLSTDAMRLIPVDLRLAYPTIHQPDSGCAFQLSPSSATVSPSQESFNAKPSALATRSIFLISPSSSKSTRASPRSNTRSVPSRKCPEN